MAECPNCGRRLRLRDWKQYCPQCGTNMVIYDLQERLMKDADIAEVQHYHFQKKLDNLKASFKGTKMSIVRIFTSLAPIGALFLPLYAGRLGGPLGPFEGKVNVISIYNGFSKIGTSVTELLSSADGRLLLAAIACLALSAVMILVHMALTILSCSPHARQRNTVQGVLLTGLPAAAIICAALANGEVASGAPAFGAYLYLALQIINVGIDLFVTFRGTEVAHKQCYVGGIPIEEYFDMVDSGMPPEDIRAEQYRRLQAIQDEKMERLRLDEERKQKHRPEEEETAETDAPADADEEGGNGNE